MLCLTLYESLLYPQRYVILFPTPIVSSPAPTSLGGNHLPLDTPLILFLQVKAVLA